MIPPVLLLLGLGASAIQAPEPSVRREPVAQSAPEPVRSDSVYVFVQLDDDRPGERGGRATAGWLRLFSTRATSEIGISLSQVPGSTWIAGLAGGSLKTSPNVTLLGHTAIGGGERTGTAFPYQIYRGGVRWVPHAGRVGLQVEDQYLHVDTTRGHLVKFQGDVTFRSRFVAQGAYHKGAGDNLDAEFVSFRVDAQRTHLGLLGGLSIGRTSPHIVDIGFAVDALDSKEFFGGIRFARKKQEFSLILDALEVEGLHRIGVGLGWRVAL
jgi:hypothetical protein